jgi:cyclic pyranopterin phosphate synthase
MGAFSLQPRERTHFPLWQAENRGFLGPPSLTRGAGASRLAQTCLLQNRPGTVGLITPWSRHFCPSCNRLRVTTDGYLRPCLLSDIEVDLRDPLRRGARKNEMRGVIQRAVELKPMRHHLQQTGGWRGRTMSEIGG